MHCPSGHRVERNYLSVIGVSGVRYRPTRKCADTGQQYGRAAGGKGPPQRNSADGRVSARLACYGSWRLLDALTQRRGAAKRVSSFVIAVVYFGLCAQAVRLISGQASNNGASSNPVPLVAKVLRWSGGPAIGRGNWRRARWRGSRLGNLGNRSSF